MYMQKPALRRQHEAVHRRHTSNVLWLEHWTEAISSCRAWTAPSADGTSKWDRKESAKNGKNTYILWCILILVWAWHVMLTFPRQWDCLILPLVILPLVYSHLKLRIHLRTLCFENLFFHELLANQGKMTNQLQTTGSYVKIVGEIRKSSCENGREQKFRRTSYPLSHKHPLCSSKKLTGDGSQQIVRKPRTNYTDIVFLNKFASVYAALNELKLIWIQISIWNRIPACGSLFNLCIFLNFLNHQAEQWQSV